MIQKESSFLAAQDIRGKAQAGFFKDDGLFYRRAKHDLPVLSLKLALGDVLLLTVVVSEGR